MGVRNYLIEGVSGTGKTAVCAELQRRGLHAINGDRALAYQGDPETGKPLDGIAHEHHLWDVGRVRVLAADHREPVTFFCGGSRNVAAFLDVFDEVFVLDVDLDTLHRRLDQRPPDEWGSKPAERELIVRLHRTKEDLPPTGIVIDATPPGAEVADGGGDPAVTIAAHREVEHVGAQTIGCQVAPGSPARQLVGAKEGGVDHARRPADEFVHQGMEVEAGSAFGEVVAVRLCRQIPAREGQWQLGVQLGPPSERARDDTMGRAVSGMSVHHRAALARDHRLVNDAEPAKYGHRPPPRRNSSCR